MAPQLQTAMMAHINEHLGFEYRIQIEQQLGMTLPPQTDEAGEDIPMNPEVEARLAPMLAQAATRLMAQNQAEAAQKQAQQQAQDPIIQMQQQELQLKAQENQRKVAKDQADVMLKQAQLEVEKERIAVQAKVDSAKAIMQSNTQKGDADKKMIFEGLKQLSAQNNQQTLEKQRLMAQGLDRAHAHAQAENKREPKKKGE
jgi:endonuclease/exonuclease/phosphatase (EEP) superfamily protein YafD